MQNQPSLTWVETRADSTEASTVPLQQHPAAGEGGSEPLFGIAASPSPRGAGRGEHSVLGCAPRSQGAGLGAAGRL